MQMISQQCDKKIMGTHDHADRVTSARKEFAGSLAFIAKRGMNE